LIKDYIPAAYIEELISHALEEDSGLGDITSEILIPCDLKGEAFLLAKESGVVAGIEIAEMVFKKVDADLSIKRLKKDGDRIQKGDVILRVTGNVRSMLKAERVSLNFIQRLSGIATMTDRFVAEVKDLKVEIADTRKTTPGFRLLEKYAVRMGGGRNHRMNLSDAVLIKDNHVDALKVLGMSYQEIVEKAITGAPAGISVEAEARTPEEAEIAAGLGVNIVMLDNMPAGEMSRAVELIAGRAEIEASGGFSLDNIREAARTGIDFISVGSLTHSFRSLDISLEYDAGSMKT